MISITKIGEAILQKFVNEEIMTKSELDHKLDAVMNKYVAHINDKFTVLQRDMNHHFEQVDKHINTKPLTKNTIPSTKDIISPPEPIFSPSKFDWSMVLPLLALLIP